MFGHNPYYHRSIRTYVTLFGNLFNDITLVRHDHNMVEKERCKVPISYAPKEKFVQRLTSDPTLTKSIATTVPRFSFEMTSMQYDAPRKQQSTIRHSLTPIIGANATTAGYVGVPYNFEFALSLYVRNIEDGLQIVEQILPFFLPDYTVTAVVSQELNIIKDIPIILKGVTEKIDYEGGFADGTRMITWDFEFSLKGWLFGPVDTSKIIMGVSANIANANAVVTGGITVNLLETANTIDGNTTTGKDASIWIYQNPITANQNTDYGYTTFINEYPNA